MGIGAGIGRRLDLLDHLIGADDLLAGHMPAAFRPHLVLDHDAGEAGILEGADDEMYVQGIAVAGIGIGREQEIGAGGDRPARPEVLLEAHDPHVGPSEIALRQAGARDRPGPEPGLLHQPGTVAVVNPWSEQDLRGLDEVHELAALAGHFGLPLGAGGEVRCEVCCEVCCPGGGRSRDLAAVRSSLAMDYNAPRGGMLRR